MASGTKHDLKCHIVSLLQTAHAKPTPPTQRPAVPRAEHQRRIKTSSQFCEARGIGSAGLKGYQFGQMHPHLRSKQIVSILKFLVDQETCFKILGSSRADPSPLGAPRLALGIRDSMSKGMEVRIRKP